MAAVSGRRIGNRLITNPRKSSGPGATVTQFPVLARRAFIARIAVAMRRKRSDDAAETYLAGELRRYRRERQGQGIRPPSSSRNCTPWSRRCVASCGG